VEIEHGRKGTPSRVGEAATFSGRAMLDPLLEDENGEVRVNSVMFSPGGRTFWHSHAGGQVLIVASGHGMVESRDGHRERLNPGDVVWAPPGEVHWHGAAPESFINPTAISLGLTEWAEQVDDAHYQAAFGDQTGTVFDGE
jgi:quercetin dioxygenase-like cupin family protein